MSGFRRFSGWLGPLVFVAGCGAGKGADGSGSGWDSAQFGGMEDSCARYEEYVSTCDLELTEAQQEDCADRQAAYADVCGGGWESELDALFIASIECLESQGYCPGDELTAAVSECYAAHYAEEAEIEASCPEGDTGDTGDTGTEPLGPGDCLAPELITFAPDDTDGESLTLYDDVLEGPLDMGFGFSFYGTSYEQLWVSSNGFVSFTEPSTDGCCEGLPIPLDDHLNGLIALAWTDLNPGGGGAVTWSVKGDAPQRRFVLSFTEVPRAYADTTVSTQMILYEADHLIELHTSNLSQGGVTTQGSESDDGQQAHCQADRVATDFGLEQDAILIRTEASK